MNQGHPEPGVRHIELINQIPQRRFGRSAIPLPRQRKGKTQAEHAIVGRIAHADTQPIERLLRHAERFIDIRKLERQTALEGQTRGLLIGLEQLLFRLSRASKQQERLGAAEPIGRASWSKA